jgi:hypothetical protein
MLNHKSIKNLLLTTLILACLAGLSAWSITDTYFGNDIASPDGRGYTMGGTGTYDDIRPFGISLNPANLTLMNRRFGIQGAMLVNRNEDNRDVPLYNSFDNYIDDAVYASNINFYDNYAAAGFASYPLGSFRLGAGAFYKPMKNFDGIYEEEIRNNRNTDNDGYPEKVAINGIDNSGLLNQMAVILSFGVALGESMDLNLGSELSLLTGSIEQEKTIRWSQWAINTFSIAVPDTTRKLPNYTLTSNSDLTGKQFKVGATLRMNNRLGVGFTFTPKTTLDRTGDLMIYKDAYGDSAAVDITTTIDEDYILPLKARIGFNYQPRNIMRTWFNLDAEYVKYSDLSEHYDDVVNLYAGVEHHVTNRLPLRLGFQAVTGYLRNVETDGSLLVKKILTPQITAGSSFELIRNVTLDLGFGYSWREYEALDLFGDAYYNDKLYTGQSSYVLWPNQYIVLADRGWENPDKVRENNISFTTSLSYTW